MYLSMLFNCDNINVNNVKIRTAMYDISLGTLNILTMTRTPQGASNTAYNRQDWQLSPASRLKETELKSYA